MKILKYSLLAVGALILAVALAIGTLFVVNRIKLSAIDDTGLPKLSIYTEGEEDITSKEEYLSCTVTLEGASENFDFSDLPAGIRGRGNTTWKWFPKKPYRIKFDEKQPMFGEKKNKSWVLLALYNDFSYIKDRLAFGMADAIGTDGFVPSYNYVELYLNGSYEGLYLLTDQVDENSGRCAVEEDFTAEDTDVPFLVEMDEYSYLEGEKDVAWFTVNYRDYTVKYPEAEDRYNEEQFLFIKDYIKKTDDLINKKGVTLAELSTLIDVQSFIDYYIVQEAMGQSEINGKSVYMSREKGGVLKMGPVWDFDWSVTGPHAWWTARGAFKDNYEGLRSNSNWFSALYHGSPEFRVALAARYKEVRDDLFAAIEDARAEALRIRPAARRDFLLWHGFSFAGDYVSLSEEVFVWCENRLLWLDRAFGEIK